MYDVYLSKWELDLVTNNFEGWQLHYRICVACYLCDFMCARVRECVCAFVSMCACVWVIAQHQLVHRFVIPPICKCCSTWDSCINLVVMLEILIFFFFQKKALYDYYRNISNVFFPSSSSSFVVERREKHNMAIFWPNHRNNSSCNISETISNICHCKMDIFQLLVSIHFAYFKLRLSFSLTVCVHVSFWRHLNLLASLCACACA